MEKLQKMMKIPNYESPEFMEFIRKTYCGVSFIQ